MVTNGAKEEHLTTWRAGAGLAGSQPHASLSLCSAPEKAAHPSTATRLPKQQPSAVLNYPPNQSK